MLYVIDYVRLTQDLVVTSCSDLARITLGYRNPGIFFILLFYYFIILFLKILSLFSSAFQL